MKEQFNIFRTALMFYTRVPVGKINGYSEGMLNKSTRYFPLIGLLVGGVAAFTFWTANLILPGPIAVLLSMAATILFTGAFHEDGFADFCDGFGGGYTPEKILDIMKDSRIGTYGSIGLLLMLLLKFFTLNEFAPVIIPIVLISGHMFSRLFPVFLIYTAEYVRLDETSKVKPVGKVDGASTLIFALVTGVLPLFFIPWQWTVAVVVVLTVIFLFFRNYVKRKLGGYTGDVLGALQQLCELFFYISLLAVQNFIG